MRRWVSLIVLLAALGCVQQGWGSIHLVGSPHGNHGDASANNIATAAYSQGSGHSLLIGIRLQATAVSVTMSDTAGDTFATIDTLTAGDGTIANTYCVANTNANGSNVVTAALSGSTGFRAIIVHEYSGTDTASCPFTYASNVTSADPITSSSFTPSSSGDAAVAFAQCSHLSTVFTAGSGYTLQGSESYLASEDLIGTGTGSQTASMGFSGNNQFNTIAVVVLKAGSGAVRACTVASAGGGPC